MSTNINRPGRQLSALASAVCLALGAVTAPAALAQDTPAPTPALTPGVVEHELNPEAPGGLTRFVVKYKESEMQRISSESMSRSLNDAASHAGTSANEARTMHNGAKVVTTDKRLSVEEADAFLDALASDPRVESAIQDDWVKPLANANDPKWVDQWSMHDVTMDYIPGTWSADVDKAWDLGVDGTGQTIAVIDTGIITNHPDLKNKLVPGYDMISDAKIALDGDARDADPSDMGNWQVSGECSSTKEFDSTWHGSHVAGIAAAQTNNSQGMAGAAPGAKILPVRIMGKCGGYVSDMLDAMVWAAGGDVPDVPANPNKASVINLSTGIDKRCTNYQDTIDKVNSLGATIMAAAGNLNVPAEWTMPANCTGVITVGATGASGKRASYSNFGPEVDIAAPGGDNWSEDAISPSGSILNPIERWRIISTVTDGKTTPGNPTYGMLEGTSMATPLVSGIVALMKQAKPGITNDQIESTLKSTATRFQVDPGLESDSFTGTKKNIGAGIVNAEAAVRAVKGLPAVTSPVTTAPATSNPSTTAPSSIAPSTVTSVVKVPVTPTVTATKTTTVTSTAKQTSTVTSTSTSTRTAVITSTNEPAPVTLTETTTLRPSTVVTTVTSTSTAPDVTNTKAPVTVTKTPDPIVVTMPPVTSTRPDVTVSTTATKDVTVTTTATERETQPVDTATVTLAPVTSTVTQRPVTTTPAPKTVTSTVVTTVPAETVVTTPAPIDVTATLTPAPVTKTVTETSTAVVSETATATSTVTSVVNQTGEPLPAVTVTSTVVEEPVENNDPAPVTTTKPAPEKKSIFGTSFSWLKILATAFAVVAPLLFFIQNIGNFGGSSMGFLPMFRP